MKITEITKYEFKDKLKSPVKYAIRKKFFAFKDSVNEIGWDAEIRDRTNDSVIINTYRVEREHRVHEVKYKAYMYFIDNQDLLNEFGVSEIDKQETPDQFQLILGW